MRRFHLIELQEQSWCPKAVRDGHTDYIQFAENTLRFYQGIVPHLAAAVKRSGAKQIVDLCSGGSGPWRGIACFLVRKFRDPAPVLLTDKFPNADAFRYTCDHAESELGYCKDPVDATAVPKHLHGFRTLFTAFHHFKPDTAFAILQDAVEKKQGIGIFEITERSFAVILMECLSFLSMFFVIPFIRPFRWSRIFYTYIIPLIPLTVLVDSIVSCLRTYSIEELKQMVQRLESKDYYWRIGKVPVKGIFMNVTYVIGYPRSLKPRAVKAAECK